MDASNNDQKPKTIATIDVNVYLQTPKRNWVEESINEHLECVLCGTNLVFQHKTNFVEGHVVEDAHCPHCKVRNRQSSHSLQ